MLGADYVGISTLVTATGAVITSIIVAIRQGMIAPKVEAIHQQVQTSNGHTLGQLVEENAAHNDATDIAGHGTP